MPGQDDTLTNFKKILFLDPTPEIKDDSALNILQSKLGFDLITTDSLQELLSILLDFTFKIDLIILNLESAELLNNRSTLDSIDIINTINSLLLFKDQKNNTSSLISTIGIKSNLKFIKSFIKAGIKGIYPIGTGFSMEEKEEALTAILSGESYLPKKIFNKLNLSKRERKTDTLYLTTRQEQIIKLICDNGSSNKNIARKLNISEVAVKIHLTKIFKMYGVSNRTQLALSAVKQNSKSI